MNKPLLSASLGNRYDTRYLINGKITLPDFELEFPDAGEHPWISFNEMITNLPWDIGEQAFSHYLIAKDQGVPLTAIPVFPSRFFPQLGAVVAKRANIKEPRDLEGKRVGVMGFGYNPAVWLRHILAHDYNVDVEKIIWIEDEDDRFLRGLNYPKHHRFQIETMTSFETLNTAGTNPTAIEALDNGLLDAFFSPAAGPPLTEHTECLFPNPYPMLDQWLQQGGIMPINTVITIRQETVDRYPALAQQLFNALCAAREMYHQEREKDPLHLGIDIEFLFKTGLFPDRYGLAENTVPIQEMIKACQEQGLIKTRFEASDLFIDLET